MASVKKRIKKRKIFVHLLRIHSQAAQNCYNYEGSLKQLGVIQRKLSVRDTLGAGDKRNTLQNGSCEGKKETKKE